MSAPLTPHTIDTWCAVRVRRKGSPGYDLVLGVAPAGIFTRQQSVTWAQLLSDWECQHAIQRVGDTLWHPCAIEGGSYGSPPTLV